MKRLDITHWKNLLISREKPDLINLKKMLEKRFTLINLNNLQILKKMQIVCGTLSAAGSYTLTNSELVNLNYNSNF